MRDISAAWHRSSNVGGTPTPREDRPAGSGSVGVAAVGGTGADGPQDGPADATELSGYGVRMGDVAVSRIALDGAGKLRVYPRAPNADYAFIYRDSSSVRWDESDRSLYVLPVDGFDVVDELRQIIKAVHGEYSDRLIVDDATVFAVPADAERKLRESVR